MLLSKTALVFRVLRVRQICQIVSFIIIHSWNQHATDTEPRALSVLSDSKGPGRKYKSMAGFRIGRFHSGSLPIANGASHASAH